MTMKIINKVKDIFGFVLELNPDGIGADETLDEMCPGYDELDRAEIIMCIEDEFGVSIVEEFGDTFKTANQITEHLISLGAIE